MIDDLSVPILVRGLAAVLLVLGGTTVMGAYVMAHATSEAQHRRRFAAVVAVPVLGLAGVSLALRGLA
jgi:hypothetical protein